MKRIHSLLLLTLLLGSCAPATASPTQPPTATVTQTVVPSLTPPPTQTAIPTATPYPPLQTKGPYLLFTYDNKNFTIMDADGSGQKQFRLPNDGYVNWNFNKSLSPDGQWLVYFTGSTDEPYDLALNLFNLEGEATFSIASLLAEDFPQNLESVASVLQSDECADSLECKLSAFRLSLIEGIHSVEWSPDSQFLAFAAQIDGPSSDMYIYSTKEKSLHRMTNDPENIYRIDWSPNGRKILYETSIEGGRLYLSTMWRTVDFITASETLIKDLREGSPWLALGWGDENIYYVATGSEGPIIRVRYIDVETQQSEELWPYFAEGALINSKGEIVLSFIPYEINGNKINISAGIYKLSLDGTYTKITDGAYSLFMDQDSFSSYFAIDQDGLLVSVSPAGSVTSFDRKVSHQNTPRVSPDQEKIVIVSDKGTELYSADLQLIQVWDFYQSEVIWRPDSNGIFIYEDDKLFYIPIPNGKPVLIDSCVLKDCYLSNFAWLP